MFNSFENLLVGLLALSLAPLAHAANVTWSGALNGDFENASNWNLLPNNNLTSDIAAFTGAPTTNQPQITLSNRAINGLLFSTAGGGWTLGGSISSNIITIGSSGISTAGQTTGVNTITANLSADATNQTWKVGTAGKLLITGSITSTVNTSILVNDVSNVGTMILSPASGNSINLLSTNNSNYPLQVRNGGMLILGGDGTIAPVTTSINTILNSSTGSTFGSLALTGTGNIQVNSGTWNFGDVARNSSDSALGTLEVKGGSLSFTGARFLAGGTISISGGTFKVTCQNSVYTNGGRFSFGASSGSGIANMIITGGQVDLAQANGGNTLGGSISTRVIHSGGTLQNGLMVGGGNNGGTVNTLTLGPGGTISNNQTAYCLSGTGMLISAGAIQGQVLTTGTNDISNFNFNGGTLAVAAYTAANLGYSSVTGVAGGSANVDPVANCVGKGTLYNNGGILSPGSTGIAGRTTITGNYTVNSGKLAIDLGGTAQASAFQTGQYDFLSVTGNTVLGGDLVVSTINGHLPSPGNTYNILSSTGVLSGAFNNVAFGGRVITSDYLGSLVVSKVGNTVTLGNYQTTPAPSISLQPQGGSVALNGSYNFSVTANSLAPLSYQWRKNGVGIAGATGASFTIYNSAVADAVNYDVVVSNLAGSTISSPASLYVVVPPPNITSQPVALTVTSGVSASFSVVADSLKPLIYQWRKNGVAIAGATFPTYTKTVARLVDAGDYDVVVSNEDGSSTSAAGTLSVNILPPTIATQPASQLVPIGNTGNFSVVADSEGPISYQWRKNGTNIAGATSASYAEPNIQPLSAASFDVITTNAGGSTGSMAAALTVDLFTSDIKGSRAITYNSTGVRSVVPIPTSGIHPRVYFNAEELPDIRNRLSNTVVGQEAFKMVKLYTDILRRGRSLAYDAQPTALKTMPDGTARINNVGLYDRSVTYNELIAGNTTTLVSMINAADGTGLYTLSGLMSLEAFECLVSEGQPGVSTRSANLASALTTWSNYILTLNDFPGAAGANYSAKLANHWKFGGYHNALAYDMAYNAMNQTQRDTVRKVVAKMMGGYFASDYSNTDYTDVGVAPESSAGNHVAINSFKLVTACALEGEVTTADAGYSAADLNGWFTRAVSSYHKFLTYGWFSSGAPLEGQGKNYIYGAHLIPLAKRGYNFYAHPHLQAYSKYWLPSVTQPYGYSFVKYDLLGGSGSDAEKGRAFIEPLDYIGLKWMFPNDNNADFSWRNFIRTEYKDGGGNYQTFVDLRDSKLSLRSVYYNELLPAAIFASDIGSTATWTQQNTDAQGGLDYLDCEGGTLISRSGYDPDASALLFHVRQDMGGHTFADRNTFTVSALGRLFINYNSGSTNSGLQAGNLQSIVEIDGLSMKTTPQEGTKMRIPAKLAAWSPTGGLATFATGDATYCYSQEWRWNNYTTSPVTITSGYAAEKNTHNNFRRADNKILESFGNTQFVAFPQWETPATFEGIQAKPYNPMRQVYRTIGLVRGVKPYVLCADDVQKDTATHTYKWFASMAKDLTIVTGASLPAGCDPATDVVLQEPAATGNRRLLVRILRAQGTPTLGTDASVQGTALAYTEILSNATTGESWKRLVIQRNSVVAPEYRVLLFPFRSTDTVLPVTNYSGNTLSVTLGSQIDTYNFVPRTASVGGQTVTINEFTLNRGSSLLVDYRNQVEPSPFRLPSALLDTPPLAPTALTATALSGTQVRLNWVDNATNETAYVVESAYAGSKNWVPLATTLLSGTTTFTDSAVTPGTSYEYRIRCVAPSGLSDYAKVTVSTP